MKRIAPFLVRLGEPLLWLGFVAGMIAAFDHSSSIDGPTIAGIFALAAIGVRATRPDRVQAPKAANGDQ